MKCICFEFIYVSDTYNFILTRLVQDDVHSVNNFHFISSKKPGLSRYNFL